MSDRRFRLGKRAARVRDWLRKPFTADMPYWSAMSSLIAIAVVPSVFLVVLLSVLVRLLRIPTAGLGPHYSIISFSDAVPSLVIGAPLVETMILAAALSALSLLRLPPLQTSAISALGWAAAHAVLSSPLQFVGVIWLFFVCSWGYVIWRPKSFAQAFGIALAPHMAQNFVVVYIVLLLRGP